MSASRVGNEGTGTRVRAHLTRRQRIALVHASGMSTDEVLNMEDAGFDLPFFQANNVKAESFRAAGLTPIQLKARGVGDAQTLRALEFNALDLVDSSWCASAISAFGADRVVAEFVLTSQDAVVLAGTGAMHQLGLDIATLLLLCSGVPRAANAVLQLAQPRSQCLQGVAPATLSDAGIRAEHLRALGLDAAAVARQTRASAEQLNELGFGPVRW